MAKNLRKAVSSERLAELAAIAPKISDVPVKTFGRRVLEQLRYVDITLLRPNPFQPRKTFSDEQLADLTTSITEQGIIQPVVGKANQDGTFTLIAGHRRWLAAQKAGLSVIPMIVREASDEELQLLALIENIQREDLHTIDKAQALIDIADQFSTQEEAAQAVGMKRSSFANWLCVRELSPEVLDICRQIPDFSLKSLQRLTALPPNRRLMVARQMQTMATKTTQPEETKPVLSSPNLMTFHFDHPTHRYHCRIEVRARTRKHQMSRQEVREFLQLALESLNEE
ncbi:MAG TPA: ParB/RepB/Spo0J family partition protein [Acidobacteriota bacterium]|nr:ParB/RepB/Spo0J family partition protein [Acidobacteriota bacterium]HNB73272.1 ParB/RepB/Spo0J family partition protein [Acidobacteriota bacterium]HNJ43635.1 ParB/RepB/Spo0J family partition protein [Acidobacteriota bacterium]